MDFMMTPVSTPVTVPVSTASRSTKAARKLSKAGGFGAERDAVAAALAERVDHTSHELVCGP
jgi:rhodanese-related sulfurtransferase